MPAMQTVRRVLIAACILQSAVCTVVQAEVLDRVLAVVSGDLILLSDVTAARDLGLVVTPSGTADPTRFVLTRLIDRALVLSEVDRYAPPEPTSAAVDREVEQVRRQTGGETAFRAVLRQSGIDERRLRQILREDLRIRAYLDQRFTLPQPPEPDIVRYYREHQQVFTRDDRVLPFDQVRLEAIQALASERRSTMIEDWLAGLRRRAEISDLYVQGR